jgi:alpha/beta superfamily hydrolase
MAERLRIPGSRDVRATLDEPTRETETVVVACPPHPQMGGDRTDARLRAVSDALVERDIACLRIDYGPWDDGEGEQTDVHSALAWAHERYENVGLFGYSFGGAVALLAAAAATGEGPAAVAVLSPASTLGGQDTAPAAGELDCPLKVVYGKRDSTVDSRPVADRARETGGTVETLAADHFFVGQHSQVADSVATFLDASL